MHFIMVYITDGDQIFNCILAFVLVMLEVVEFEHFPGIVGRQHRSGPPASHASEMVSLKHGDPHRVRYSTVVFVRLPIFFQHVNANSQIVPSAVFGNDGPAILCAEFADAASPFLFGLCEIS